jgi:hypothetical protein
MSITDGHNQRSDSLDPVHQPAAPSVAYPESNANQAADLLQWNPLLSE